MGPTYSGGGGGGRSQPGPPPLVWSPGFSRRNGGRSEPGQRARRARSDGLPPKGGTPNRRRREENPSAATAQHGANVPLRCSVSGRTEGGVPQARTPAVPLRNRTLAGGFSRKLREFPPPRHLGGYILTPALQAARFSPGQRRDGFFPIPLTLIRPLLHHEPGKPLTGTNWH